MSIAENLTFLRSEIAAACARAGRDSASVRLMAVSKTQPAAALREAYAAGQRLFGENRVQEIQAKHTLLADLPDLELHLIGPLQNNKAARAAEFVHAIDTLDSLKTAERLQLAAARLGKRLGVLVEVKLSPEDTKHGLDPQDLGDFLRALRSFEALDVRGLMTVPPEGGEPEAARPYFRDLRDLRDRHQGEYPGLTEISMGMSGDFRVAIEEGSTTVRLGTALFGARNQRPEAEAATPEAVESGT